MNGTIMFSLKMQDFMSSGLMKVASNSNSAFNKMTTNANKLVDKNKILGLSYNELQSKIKQVEDTISKSNIPSQIAQARRELSSLQRMSSNHIGNTNSINGSGKGSKGLGIGGIAIGSMIGGLATGAISMGARFIKDGISTMIQKSMDKETAINGLSTFLGKQGANETYKNIEKDAEATPFDTASLLQVNRSLISAGLNAKSARVDSMNLANAIVAVGGSNDTLTRMAANMQQIKTVGKASAMDVKQFGLAGINIYELLAKSTGKNIEQVKEMDVTYEQLSAALAMGAGKGGLYYKALENAQNSMQGKWSNFQERIVNTLANIGTAFSPFIKGILEIGTSILDAGKHLITFANWLTGASTSANVFLTIIGVLGGAFITYQAIMGGVALVTGIVTAAQWLLNIAMTANPIGLVVVAIGALIAGFAIAYNRFAGFRQMVDGVWGALKQVGSNIMNVFSEIPDKVINAFMRIPIAIKKVFSGVGDLFSAIFNGNFKSIPSILAGIGGNLLASNPITGFASDVFSQTTKGVGDAFSKAKSKSRLDTEIANAKKYSESQNKETPLGAGATLLGNNSASGKAAGDTVSGAGPKVINITVGKFFDNLTFTTLNGRESATELENIVMECLARVVYNGSKMV